MSLFARKSPRAQNTAYPLTDYKPVIRQSICTGEKTACMQNRKTGKLTELMLIKTESDLNAFMEEYGILREEIETIY